jgi:general secretion pathway protein H
MPISAVGSKQAALSRRGFVLLRRSAEHGFTLVELMVVITIIGLASAAVVLAMPDPRGRLVDEADRFAAKVRVAHDAAILDGRTTSVWVAPGGYGFQLHTAKGWVAMPDKALRVAQWGSGVVPQLPPDGRVRVTFDSTGLADQPLDLRLTRGGAMATVRIGAGGEVRVDG